MPQLVDRASVGIAWRYVCPASVFQCRQISELNLTRSSRVALVLTDKIIDIRQDPIQQIMILRNMRVEGLLVFV